MKHKLNKRELTVVSIYLGAMTGLSVYTLGLLGLLFAPVTIILVKGFGHLFDWMAEGEK